MAYNTELVVEKLAQWEVYWSGCSLPAWEEIPNLGLYMEQVTSLLTEYLSVPMSADREEPVVTATAINNYVRKKVMPKPIKKKYYRYHIAYLIIICTLKYCLSIPTLQIMIPSDLPEAEMERVYTDYVSRHKTAVGYFVSYMRAAASAMAGNGAAPDGSPDDPEKLITTMAMFSGLSRMLAEKLLQLNDNADSAAAPSEES